MKKIFEKAVETLKETWQFLNGKKTTIGMVLMLTAQGLQAFFPHALTHDQIDFIQAAGAAVGGLGLLHKGAKTETAHKLTHYKTK